MLLVRFQLGIPVFAPVAQLAVGNGFKPRTVWVRIPPGAPVFATLAEWQGTCPVSRVLRVRVLQVAPVLMDDWPNGYGSGLLSRRSEMGV